MKYLNYTKLFGDDGHMNVIKYAYTELFGDDGHMDVIKYAYARKTK